MTAATPATPDVKEDAKAPAKAETKVETTKASTSADAPIQDVKYTGQASLRTISKEDWLSLGIEHEGVEWNFHNNFRVPAEDLTDGAIKYLTKKDGRFELVDAEDDVEDDE